MSGVAAAKTDEAWISMNAMARRLGHGLAHDVKAVWHGLIEQHNAGGKTRLDGIDVATSIRKVDGVSRLFVHEVSAHTVERAVQRESRARLDRQVQDFLSAVPSREAEAPGMGL